MAIAYHPKFTYLAVEVHDDVYIVAKELLGATAEACGWESPATLAEFPGDRMEGTVFQHPFLERKSLGILGDHVTLEQGTGAVHTAPGHGQEDYRDRAAIRHRGLLSGGWRGQVLSRGRRAEGVLPEELIGKTVWQANPIVIDLLTHAGALLATRKIEHSYPHCWRCHNPTIFRATEQWFIGMDRNDLRGRTL